MIRLSSVSCLILLTVGVTDSSAQILFRPILGGLPADSGIAAGFELERYQTLGPYDARARFIGSVKKYEHAELALVAPPPATHDFFSEFRIRYRNYPEEDFWGLGPDSMPDRRSTYRLEDFALIATAGLHFRSGLRVAATVGWVEVHIGPGQDRDFPSTEAAFSRVEVPDLGERADHWHAGTRIDYDRRDNREDPRTGDLSAFEWSRFWDRTPGEFRFDRYVLEYQRFVPLSARHRILAARVRAVFSDDLGAGAIPFFLQPSMGGTSTLRGFPQYRFRSDNAVILNLEYRHELVPFIDAIAFADAGQVARRASDFSMEAFRGSGGVGTRVKFGGNVFFGVDVGFSREGTQLWFRSGHFF